LPDDEVFLADYPHGFVETINEEEEEDNVPADENETEADDEVAPLATPQMSMKRGIKVFGEDGVAAVKKEMLQLHDWKVMAPKQAKELTPEQKKEALAYLMFLKCKCCGKIKGRGCADG
jgi:CO dehydrogenase/acetyl-CoA synthase beta subunit